MFYSVQGFRPVEISSTRSNAKRLRSSNHGHWCTDSECLPAVQQARECAEKHVISLALACLPTLAQQAFPFRVGRIQSGSALELAKVGVTLGLHLFIYAIADTIASFPDKPVWHGGLRYGRPGIGDPSFFAVLQTASQR